MLQADQVRLGWYVHRDRRRGLHEVDGPVDDVEDDEHDGKENPRHDVDHQCAAASLCAHCSSSSRLGGRGPAALYEPHRLTDRTARLFEPNRTRSDRLWPQSRCLGIASGVGRIGLVGQCLDLGLESLVHVTKDSEPNRTRDGLKGAKGARAPGLPPTEGLLPNFIFYFSLL